MVFVLRKGGAAISWEQCSRGIPLGVIGGEGSERLNLSNVPALTLVPVPGFSVRFTGCSHTRAHVSGYSINLDVTNIVSLHKYNRSRVGGVCRICRTRRQFSCA